MADPAAYAMNWLLKNGYAQPQAAAMVGHGMQESGLNPNASGDNGTAYGAFQWRGPRLAGLYNFAAAKGQDPANIDTQLGYMDHELHTTEKGAGDALFGSTDVRGATRAGMMYERPAGYTADNPEAGHGWANRYGKAVELAGGAPAGQSGSIAPMMQPAAMPGPPQGLAAAFVQPMDDEFARQRAVAAAQDQERRRALLGRGGVGQFYG